MALLSIADRTRVWRGLQRRWSNDLTSCAFTKLDLYNPTLNTGAIADTDSWIDTHGGNTTPDNVGFNGSLTVAMRAAMTVNQKTDMFLATAAMRRGIDYLRSVFGDID